MCYDISKQGLGLGLVIAHSTRVRRSDANAYGKMPPRLHKSHLEAAGGVDVQTAHDFAGDGIVRTAAVNIQLPTILDGCVYTIVDAIRSKQQSTQRKQRSRLAQDGVLCPAFRM